MAKTTTTANEFIDAIKSADKKKTVGYDTAAEVVRVENNTAWVHIPGGVDETPVQLTVNASVGDTVQLRVSGGSAWIVGNKTAPPTDDTKANAAQTTAMEAKVVADSAQSDALRASDAADSAEASAISAQQSATAATRAANTAQAQAQNASEYAARALGNLSTVQSVAETLTWITAHGTMTLTSDVALDPTHVYFVVDAGGDYTVNGVTYAIVTEPDVNDIGTYYELSIDESLNNYVGTHLALTQEGLWLLPAASGTNKVLIATGAGSTYTTAGTYIIDSSGGTVASFRANGATIGEVLNGQTRTEIGTSGMQIVQRAGGNDTAIANLGYGPGTNSGGGTSNAPYYTFGTRATTSTAYSSSATYSVGNLCVYNGIVYACKTAITTPEAWNSAHWVNAIGNYSTAEGQSGISAGFRTHTEGASSKALGSDAHAEGMFGIASGGHSHAEGGYTTASANGAHAEGEESVASAYAAHAEGSETTASGIRSHAEGTDTTASGYAAHAEGDTTTASGERSHAEGSDTTASGDYSHAEGFGTTASGHFSHAQNIGTTAQRKSQTTVGEYNVLDTAGTTATRGDYSVIVGNGTADNARSNALTIKWDGETDVAGQILTSFKDSVAMGSYGSAQSTVDGLVGEIRYSSGAAGSASINTAYTKSGVTIPTGWYNYFYMPHRSGGKNGAANGDNHQYGNLFLFGMNNTNGQFVVRVSSGAIAEVVKLVTTASIISEDKLLQDNVTINANSYGNGSLSVAKTGYTPVGIVGMHLENASSSGVNNTYCACHSFYLSGTTAYWIVKNNHTATAKIKVTATILYVKS